MYEPVLLPLTRKNRVDVRVRPDLAYPVHTIHENLVMRESPV